VTLQQKTAKLVAMQARASAGVLLRVAQADVYANTNAAIN
jgi:hypothetical protein